MKIIEMQPEILEILTLYLAKLQVLTEGERKVIMDTLKLYIYPKYVIDKLVKRTGEIGRSKRQIACKDIVYWDDIKL